MSNYGVIRKKIAECIKSGWDQFIIFPFAENGMLAKQILNQAFGIQEVAIVDSELCEYNREIKSIEDLKEKCKNLDKYVLFIASIEESVIEFAQKNIPCGKTVGLEKKKKIHYTDIGRYSYGPLTEQNIRVKSVGSFCSFAIGVDAVWNHPLDMVTNHNFIYENTICKEVNNQKYSYVDFNQKFVIGNDVWLGRNVILTNGVKIGNGVRVAAGAVVTKDLPDYAIAAGIPAKIIGYRFSNDQIRKLNEIAWWDWPVEKINECYDDFIDIDVFLEKHQIKEEISI